MCSCVKEYSILLPYFPLQRLFLIFMKLQSLSNFCFLFSRKYTGYGMCVTLKITTLKSRISKLSNYFIIQEAFSGYSKPAIRIQKALRYCGNRISTKAYPTVREIFGRLGIIQSIDGHMLQNNINDHIWIFGAFVAISYVVSFYRFN